MSAADSKDDVVVNEGPIFCASAEDKTLFECPNLDEELALLNSESAGLFFREGTQMHAELWTAGAVVGSEVDSTLIRRLALGNRILKELLEKLRCEEEAEEEIAH